MVFRYSLHDCGQIQIYIQTDKYRDDEAIKKQQDNNSTYILLLNKKLNK